MITGSERVPSIPDVVVKLDVNRVAMTSQLTRIYFDDCTHSDITMNRPELLTASHLARTIHTYANPVRAVFQANQ